MWDHTSYQGRTTLDPPASPALPCLQQLAFPWGDMCPPQHTPVCPPGQSSTLRSGLGKDMTWHGNWFPAPVAGPASSVCCWTWSLRRSRITEFKKTKCPQRQYKAKDLHSPISSNITMKWSNFAYLYSYSTRTCWIFITVTSLAPLSVHKQLNTSYLSIHCFKLKPIVTERNCLFHTRSPHLPQKRWLRDNCNAGVLEYDNDAFGNEP